MPMTVSVAGARVLDALIHVSFAGLFNRLPTETFI